jgi:hypothetical protein
LVVSFSEVTLSSVEKEVFKVEPKKGVKTFSNLLSKTAGLVFFSFLAISLGVVFGLLFEGWVKDQPGTPVGSESTNLQTTNLPTETTENIKITDETAKKQPTETLTEKPAPQVKFKVRVGPYANRNEAVSASQQLETQGYPVYVGNNPPFAVQVGAFGAQGNADRLKTELTGKGYKVFVEQN